MNIKSVTVCRMNEIYKNLILKWTGKRTGKEPETNFVIASIVAQVSQLTFIYLLRLAITPNRP